MGFHVWISKGILAGGPGSETDRHYCLPLGGYVKDLHGQKNIYYQVNATYFSALGEDERKMLLARALQIFMPGKPQIWYLDLFAGKNDYEAVKKAGPGGHKGDQSDKSDDSTGMQWFE